MIRAILTTIAGLFLTALLLIVSGRLMIELTGQSELIAALLSEAISKDDFAAAYFDAGARLVFYSELAVFPLIALTVGSFVGLLAKKLPWLLALIAIFPIFIFVFEISLKGISLSLAYALTAVAAALIVNRLRFRSSRAVTT